MIKYYAGIGSRQTPELILALMKKVASYLEQHEYVLRSGGANGADSAFASGCTVKQIYVPWDDFNNLPLVYPIPEFAFTLASSLHPAWDKLSKGAKTLMARNCMQILGPNLDHPSSFVICWTKDGCSKDSERTSKTGGTGQAISLANRNGIPVFNLAREEHLSRFNFLLN